MPSFLIVVVMVTDIAGDEEVLYEKIKTKRNVVIDSFEGPVGF